jgi:hypothetical protein
LSGAFDDNHEHVVAAAAAGDETHRLAIHHGLAQHCDIATGLTLPLRRRRFEREKFGGRAREDVAVEVIHQVPPNRSVRMVSGACPRLIKARETASTNPVRPQM